jgi:hypothetical protein
MTKIINGNSLNALTWAFAYGLARANYKANDNKERNT